MDAERQTLQAGDEIKCWRCTSWHRLHEAPTTGPFKQPMLFVTCGDGKEYYAGNAGNPAERPTRPRQ